VKVNKVRLVVKRIEVREKLFGPDELAPFGFP
jgi:hypothetical protein